MSQEQSLMTFFNLLFPLVRRLLVAPKVELSGTENGLMATFEVGDSGLSVRYVFSPQDILRVNGSMEELAQSAAHEFNTAWSGYIRGEKISA